MRLEKISLNQLKKDLRKLYTKKKRSRFGESSPPGLTEEQIKSQKRDDLRRKMKNAAKVAGALALGGLLVAGTVKGAKAAAKTDAFQTVKGAVVARGGYEKQQAMHKFDKATQHAQSMVETSKQNLQKSFGGLQNAADASRERTVQDLSKAAGNFAGNVARETGNVVANAVTLKGKATAGVNNALSGVANQLAASIAPRQTGN